MSPTFYACDHTAQFLSDRRQKLRLVAGSHDHCSCKPFAFAHQILSQQKRPHAVSKHLPIFFVAGADDPVGAFGKGVKRVYERFKKSGIKNVSLKLYEGDRHEILNETDRRQVYEDLYRWMERLRA